MEAITDVASDPRWLGGEPVEVGDTDADPGLHADLVRAIESYDDFIGMFATDGWERLDEILAEKERTAQVALTAPQGGLKDLNEIYAMRQRLSLIAWLRGLPADVREKREFAQEQLNQIPQQEEEDAARS